MKILNYTICFIYGFILFSCNSDKQQTETIINDFKGKYKIVAIVSDKDFDLNNDGIKSLNILSEIISPHTTPNGIINDFHYYPENISSLASARPLPQHSGNDAQFISFNFPEQELSFLNQNPNLPVLLFSGYTGQFNYHTYVFKSQNEIKIIDNNPEYHSQFGEIKKLTRIDQNTFEIEITKRIYDFKDKSWFDANLVAKYIRI
jgi:hypothetical protein